MRSWRPEVSLSKEVALGNIRNRGQQRKRQLTLKISTSTKGDLNKNIKILTLLQ